MYVQGTFEAPLQHFRTHDAIWEEEEPQPHNPSPGLHNAVDDQDLKRSAPRSRKARRPVSAMERQSQPRSQRAVSVNPVLEKQHLRSSRTKMRSQFDELNVLERVFDDIMMFGDQEDDGAYYYNKSNDELLNETEFLEFVELHPDQLDQCCDVEIAMEEMCGRWAFVRPQLEDQHHKLSAALMQSAVVDQDSEQHIQGAQDQIREHFRDLRQELDQREENMLSEVETSYNTQVQQHLTGTQGGEEHLERVDRCRELGNRLCSNLKPMLLPFCNKLLFSKAQRLLEKPIATPSMQNVTFKIVTDSLNQHSALLDQLAKCYRTEVVPSSPH